MHFLTKDTICISEEAIYEVNCINMGKDLLRSGGDIFTYLKLLSACATASAKTSLGSR